MRNLDRMSNLLFSGALIGALLTLGACQNKEAVPEQASQTPAPVTQTHATISNEFSATAEVVKVDAKSRVVTLRHDDGSLTEVKCGEAVRNFAQIAVGDTLHVQYKESLDATLRPAGETAEEPKAVATAVGAEPGSTPAGGVGVGVSVRVKIESVDVEHDIVVFSLASGELAAHKVVTPEGREFLKGLKIGDTVQLDYTEVLALAIEKV